MFTNWLTSSAASSSAISSISNLSSSSSPSFNNTQSPDVLIEVGPPPFSRFAAHRNLICMHSGYIRAALIRDANTTTTSSSSLENSIYIPNVTVEQFTPLLTYMYTGFLDLNVENIFGVLLATHILHMPRALEICRSFLNRQQNEEYFNRFNKTNNCSVIRPIPSKAVTEHGIAFISPPMSHNILLPSRDTTFKRIINEREKSPIPSTSQKSPSYHAHSNGKNEIKHKELLSQTPPSSTNNATSSKSLTVNKNIKLNENVSQRTSPPPQQLQQQQQQQQSIESTSPTPSSTTTTNLSKIIIDVASCDGPVRFHRVLNDAYGQTNTCQQNMSPIEKRHNSNYTNITTSFHQQMAKHIIERNNLIDESENSQDTIQHKDNSNGIINSELFICVYCKHTFKSQYCYQKHAKRHINPLNIDNGSCGDTSSSVIELIDGKLSPQHLVKHENISAILQAVSSSSSLTKREVRPLDMNVQYYPCKTCGCKFPSYYFVHKHRKLCHADEEN